MTALTWDKTGERYYETGVDHGVLYVYDKTKSKYGAGVAWNGLTTVTESPSGAEPTPLYADNIKYLNLMSVEEFGGTIEAYTYPDEFAMCDGSAVYLKDGAATGLAVSQQPRAMFGFAYRTRVGNDVDYDQHGYKIHIVWGAMAQPSERAYATVNESPEAITFSWTFTTTPETIDDEFNMKPTSHMVIDSTKVSQENKQLLANLEEALFGSDSTDPTLPTPSQILKMFKTGNKLATLETTDA